MLCPLFPDGDNAGHRNNNTICQIWKRQSSALARQPGSFMRQYSEFIYRPGLKRSQWLRMANDTETTNAERLSDVFAISKMVVAEFAEIPRKCPKAFVCEQ